MNGSNPCSLSLGAQAPTAKRRRPRLRAPCSPSPPPSPRGEYVFSVAQICNLPYRRIAFCGTSAWSRALECSDALPITNRRYGRLQICATRPRCALNTYRGEGERRPGAGKFGRCGCSPRFFVFRVGDTRQQSSAVLPKHGRMFLPLLGERAGVRGNEANSNPRRTTISGTVKLRKPPGKAWSFPIWI
jgi:hypothetical protein